MVQFLSINFFSWISSIFVGFFKSSRFFVSQCINLGRDSSCIGYYKTGVFIQSPMTMNVTADDTKCQCGWWKKYLKVLWRRVPWRALLQNTQAFVQE